MESKKQIFLVYSCNEWRETPMHLLMATESPRKVKMFISKLIEEGDAEYAADHDVEHSSRKMAKDFRKDFERRSRDELNDRLAYVWFDYVHDGEEL